MGILVQPLYYWMYRSYFPPKAL